MMLYGVIFEGVLVPTEQISFHITLDETATLGEVGTIFPYNEASNSPFSDWQCSIMNKFPRQVVRQGPSPLNGWFVLINSPQ